MYTLIDTVVVGGGQAGLSVSWHLKQAGHDHVVLDRGQIGDTWRKGHRRAIFNTSPDKQFLREFKSRSESVAVIRLDLTQAFKTSGKARADHRKNQAGIPAFASPAR